MASNLLTIKWGVKYRKVYTHIKQREENQVVLSLEESAKLRAELQKTEDRLRELVADKQTEIQRLKESLRDEYDKREHVENELGAKLKKTEDELSITKNNLVAQTEARSNADAKIKKLEAELTKMNEIQNSNRFLQDSLKHKEATIAELGRKLEELKKSNYPRKMELSKELKQVYHEITSNPELFSDFTKIAPSAINGLPLQGQISVTSLTYFLGKEIIVSMNDGSTYVLTKNGRELYDYMRRI